MHQLYSDPGGNAAVLAALAIFYTFAFIFAIAGYLITSWFFMKIFEKAGVQGKWRAWVPFYNTLIFVKLGDLNPWWLLVLWGGTILLSWIPVIGPLIGLAAFVYTLLAAWRVGLKLQKEAVWLILYFFLSIVWLGINAFDKSRWNTAIAPAPWAGNFLADKTVWAGIPAQQSSIGYAGPGGAAPGGYPPPPGYQEPPQGYAQPPQGYQPPPAGGYAPAPSAASPTPASPEPPASSPSPSSPPPPSPPAASPVTPPAERDVPPPSTEPPADPDSPPRP